MTVKTLYFDIDGTVLVENEDTVKPRLGGGQLESAIKRAAFHQIVCVGNFCAISSAIRDLDIDYDGVGVVFRLCRGAFIDEVWFRETTVLIEDPQLRVNSIDFASDWWYLDDLAQYYMAQVGKIDVYRENLGRRICVPDPLGDGSDVQEWLGSAAL